MVFFPVEVNLPPSWNFPNAFTSDLDVVDLFIFDEVQPKLPVPLLYSSLFLWNSLLHYGPLCPLPLCLIPPPWTPLLPSHCGQSPWIFIRTHFQDDYLQKLEQPASGFIREFIHHRNHSHHHYPHLQCHHIVPRRLLYGCVHSHPRHLHSHQHYGGHLECCWKDNYI